MKIASMILAALLAAPASAQSPLDAEAFDALTQGRTFRYLSDGLAYGTEEYRPNRRVRWSFLDGECIEGVWFEAGEMICFHYDQIDDLQCWTFFRSGRGLVARFEDGSPLDDLTGLEQTDEMICTGPEVGV